MKAQVLYKCKREQDSYYQMVLRSYNAYCMRGGKMPWEEYILNHGNRLVALPL